MKHPRCPRCDGWLDYDRLTHEVFCFHCGARFGKEAKVEKPMTAEDWKQAGKRRADDSLVNQEHFKPCPVVGCHGRMARASKQPMCSTCRRKMKDWYDSSQSAPPPLILTVKGIWMRNKMEAA